jgi:hypothetical protein
MTTLPNPIDHLYILCNKEKEPDRAAYLEHWLTQHNINPKQYTFSCFCYADTIPYEVIWRVYNPWAKHRAALRSANSYNLKLGEISLCVNWAATALEAIKANHKIVMFWESDVLPDSEFLAKLNNAMQTLEATHGANWDFLSLSSGANMRPERPPDDTMQKWFPVKNYFHTRTTDAMIFKVDMLQKIFPHFLPFAEVLDWELNFHLSVHKSRSFWLDPPIIRQGSGTVYATTL